MRLNFVFKILMLINLVLLIFQIILMGTFWEFYRYPFLNLMAPVIAFVNMVFFVFWVIKFKWPFILFIFSVLIGFKEWGKLYKFPNNAIPVSNGIKVMSFNVRLFNSYQWIDAKEVPKSIENFIQKQQLQSEQFEEIDQKNKYPTIICTDLNNNAFSQPYNRLKKNRQDAFTLSGDGLGATYKLAYFPFRIDFIFTDSKFNVINFTTHDLKLSDHKPISALMEWK